MNHKKMRFIAIIVTAMGITFTTALKESMGTLGMLFITLGAILLILASRREQSEKESKNSKSGG